MIIKMTAKCSDMCYLRLMNDDGSMKGEADGYVPGWLPNSNEDHCGDYVQLDIDIATGKILNWRKPSMADLAKTFNFKRGVKVGKV